MTENSFKKLNLEEIAILDAIIFLRINSESDIFEYDSEKVRDYLNKTGNSKKYIITPDEQREIVIKLAFDNVIDADAIINRDFIDTFRSIQNPEYKPDKSMPKYFWWYGKRWAHESRQLNGLISIEKAYELHGSAISIRMTKNEAKRLKASYMSNHIVYLDLDKTKCCLRISIDKTNDWKNLRALDENSAPYKILCCARKHVNKKISIDKIREEEELGKDFKGEYMSGIFQHTGSVNVFHPKLIEFIGKSIIFRQRAYYTYDELCNLEAKLGI